MGSPTFQAILPVPLMEPLHSPSKHNQTYLVRCLYQCADRFDAVCACACMLLFVSVGVGVGMRVWVFMSVDVW